MAERRDIKSEVQMLAGWMLWDTVSRQQMYSFPLCSLDIYCIFNEFKLRQKMKCNAICDRASSVSVCLCHPALPLATCYPSALGDFLFAASN